MQEKIIQVLVDYLGIERELIMLHSQFERDFCMDPLDFKQLIRKVEIVTNTNISDSKISELLTVYDLIEYIEEVNLQYNY